jgi:predicted amidohydrolase
VAIEDFFETIYERDLRPIDLDKAFADMHLYAGIEAAQEFDLASQLLQVQSSTRLHRLVQRWTSKKTNTNLEKPIIISTFNSGRVLAGDLEASPDQLRKFPFVLESRRPGRTRGLRVNPNADPENQYDRENQARWIKKNQDAIDVALSGGADIVCLGEFDFPPVDDRNAAESTAANESHRDWIRNRLRDAGRPAVVFAGSSHQWSEQGCANIGETFFADADDAGEIFIRHQQYEKRLAAKKMGETLTETQEPVHPFFATSLGKVAVLICMEAFDPAMVMSVFAHSRSYNKLDVILVPSYNRSEMLLRSCQQLSSLANCIVVYVNALGTAEHENAQVYLSGVSLKLWREQFEDIKTKVHAQAKPGPETVEGIPGVWNFRRLIKLAEIGRDIEIKNVGPGSGLINWTIPLGFASEAAGVMTAKHPESRGRIIASLLIDDERHPFGGAFPGS